MLSGKSIIKNKSVIIWTLVAGLIATSLVGVRTILAESSEEGSKISIESTTLFRSARGVISKNQGLINDATKGDKGLSAEFVIAGAKVNYEKAVGHPFIMADEASNLGKAQRAMFAAISDVMNQAQVLINEEGKGFKGFLPAVFAKQVADSFGKQSGGTMKIKLTAPKEYVRNRANRPDKWESNVIETQFRSADWEIGKWFAEVAELKGKSVYRFILPEYYGESCLKCHGGPKGELDITGGKKEGGKLGELGGAISFTIY